jgi:hypothetical protein
VRVCGGLVYNEMPQGTPACKLSSGKLKIQTSTTDANPRILSSDARVHLHMKSFTRW